MVTSVILCNLKSKNWVIFPTKTPPGYLVKINKKKKDVKKKKIQNIFASMYLEFYVNFFKLCN